MRTHCVNMNHPDFVKLVEDSGQDFLTLYAEVSLWQDRNNTDLIPTMEQLNSKSEVLYQKESDEGIVASEKTIRDLAARMSDRIGIPYKIIADRNQNFKGKLENGTAVINLAYASLDTGIHEILGHPIIRALKGTPELRVGDRVTYSTLLGDKTSKVKAFSKSTGMAELEDGSEIFGGELIKIQSPLYRNLLKELESGKGKEVLDRIKRDYKYKTRSSSSYLSKKNISEPDFETDQEFESYQKYTLEEQQEEAIVELLGLMTAEKLDAVKDGKLISLLKRLLKEIKAFIKDLLRQREVEVDKLPDNMSLGDLADLLAYSNSKLILPGNEVVYTTPDNQTFKTYQEASNHISKLAKDVKDVDLSKVNVVTLPLSNEESIELDYLQELSGEGNITKEQEIRRKELLIRTYSQVDNFISKNKEYEQSKEIIEEWMKVNKIRYNPDEVYSRGQEFVSIVGAYSSFDVNLMMQNLLQHIEDNQKAGGEFAVSAITKPVDRKIGHLEGGGGKIRFKIYPQSHDILWAANADVYSGSVWDAGEKINKDKKSELLGVTYSKYPALNNLHSVKPNLAEIIDDLDHHHNELGITLTGSNFRLDYDEDIPYQTKKIIDSINRILDHKYGKLRKPEIKQVSASKKKELATLVYSLKELLEIQKELLSRSGYGAVRSDYKDSLAKEIKTHQDKIKLLNEQLKNEPDSIVQPKLTSKDLKESIESIKVSIIKYDGSTLVPEKEFTKVTNEEYLEAESKGVKGFELGVSSFGYSETYTYNGFIYTQINYNDVDGDIYGRIELRKEKEYTEQALINTKIAKLKEVAKKYPRALIRSEVKKIDNNNYSSSNLFEDDELPFQKVPSKPQADESQLKSLLEQAGFKLSTLEEYSEATGTNYDVNGLVDFTARTVALANGASVDALTEEVAHIAVAQSRGSKEYAAAMTMVEDIIGTRSSDNQQTIIHGLQTEEFDQYYDQYMQKYDNDLFVREEILGKILKKDLEVKLGTSLGSLLRRIWNKFIALFKNDNLQSYISKITDEFIANPRMEIKGEGLMFQLKEEEKTLQHQVNNLNRRYRELTRRQKSNPNLLPQIKALEEELEGNKNGVGIYKFLLLLNEDTRNAIDFIKNYFTVTEKDDPVKPLGLTDSGSFQVPQRVFLGSRTDKETPSDKMTQQLAMYIGYYLPFLKELNMVLDEDSVIDRERKVLLDEMIRIHTENFEVINRAYNQFLKANNRESTGETQLTIAGKQIMSEDELQEAPRDSNFLETWFGLPRNNSDTLVRLAHRKITDIKNKIRRVVLNWSDNFLSETKDYVGKDMSWVAEKVTVQVEDKKGIVTSKIQKSGNFISEVQQGQWEIARNDFHTKLHDKYKFSQDFAERLKEKKTIESYGKGADKFQRQEVARLKEYNKEIAKWYSRNTVPNPKAAEMLLERKAALSPEQFNYYQLRNLVLNKDGSVKYYKGELVVPSRGTTRTVFDGDSQSYVDIKTTDWTNKEYFKLSQKDRDFLDYIKQQKKEIDKSIPFADSNRMPQMYESTLDIMRLNEPEVFKRLGKNIKSSIVREEDDTQFNETPQLNDGTILDDVPIRFTNLLAEPDRVTVDILSSLIAYKQMQENYVQMSAELPMFENWLQGSKRRTVKKGDKVIRGEDSWSFTALKQFLQVHVTGKEKEDLSMTILGTKVSVTKMVEKLSQWVRMKNLGFNFITMTSNLISSKVFATLESLVGNYTTTKSSAFANKEFFSILPTVISSFNGVRSTDRISSLMTYFGLGRDIREMFDDLDKHVLMRNQPDKTLMYGYEKGDYFTKSVVMIAILDNYRVKDNKWYTAKEAAKEGLNFDEMSSAYNMLKSDKDGKVTHTIPHSVIDNLTARMKTIASRVDGSLSAEDKGAIYQNAVFSMVGLHRGWLFEGLSRRLKTKGYDFTLNQVTEGEFRTVADLIGRFFMSTQKLRSIKEYLAKYNELEDYQKENLKRVMLELSMIGAFTVIALVLNSGDDDEEDYFRDLLAYQSNRVLLEVSSFYNPNEFVSAIKDPIVPARDLELVTNFTDMFNTKEIESGKWEGMTKQQKYFLQLVPGIKGYSAISDPDSQNDFLKSKNLKPLYSSYDFFMGEEEE